MIIDPGTFSVIAIGVGIALVGAAMNLRDRQFFRPGCNECTQEARRVMEAHKAQQRTLQHEYEHRFGDCSDDRCPRNHR